MQIFVCCFHKRLLNLSLLKIIYFLKKEFKKLQFSRFYNLYKSKKLINVLKAPVRNKKARNQFKFETYRSFVIYKIAETLLKTLWIKHINIKYFLIFSKKTLLDTYSSFILKKNY